MSKGYDFLGDKIKRIRILKDRTQLELGNVLGLPKQSVSMIEKGVRKVSTEELKKIASFFDIPVNFILEDGMIEILEEKSKYEPRNKWDIEVPPFIDDFVVDLDNYFDYLATMGTFNKRMIIKTTKNIIKVFQLYLKEYKEENK
jgi:transcriptional regulator with XRE-family HTH domain